MRHCLVGGLGLVVLLSSGCLGAPAEDDSDHGDNALAASDVVQPTKFAFSTGKERLTQHAQGGSDVTRTEKASVDFQNAFWLAKLSAIAEANPDGIRAQLKEIGLPFDDDHFRFFENKCTDTQAFYVTTASLSSPPAAFDNPFRAASPEFAAMVFRGTEPTSWKDIAIDIAAWARPGQSPLGNAQAGFALALDSVWMKPNPSCGLTAPIQPFLLAHHDFDFVSKPSPVRKGAELYFVGHSLGGALATLALAKTVTDPCTGAPVTECGTGKFIPVSALYTYGAPRPFDRTFSNSLARIMQDRTPIFRYVHDSDGVPFLPGAGFSHVGFEGNEVDYQIVLQDDKAIISEPVPRFKASSTLAADHHIRSYLPVIAARLGGK